jgi:hypothetical protein
MQGRAQDITDRPIFNDTAKVQDNDTISQGRHDGEIMADPNQRGAASLRKHFHFIRKKCKLQK